MHDRTCNAYNYIIDLIVSPACSVSDEISCTEQNLNAVFYSMCSHAKILCCNILTCVNDGQWVPDPQMVACGNSIPRAITRSSLLLDKQASKFTHGKEIERYMYSCIASSPGPQGRKESLRTRLVFMQ